MLATVTGVVFIVLRPARHLDDQEKVEFGELYGFLGADSVVTIRHAESPALAKSVTGWKRAAIYFALVP